MRAKRFFHTKATAVAIDRARRALRKLEKTRSSRRGAPTLPARHASRPRRACSRVGFYGASGGTRGVRGCRARAVRCRPRGRCLRGMDRRVPRVVVDAVARGEKVHAKGGGDADSGAFATRIPRGRHGRLEKHARGVLPLARAAKASRSTCPRAIAADAAANHNLKRGRPSARPPDTVGTRRTRARAVHAHARAHDAHDAHDTRTRRTFPVSVATARFWR